MFNKTEKDEKNYLAFVRGEIYNWIDSLAKTIKKCADEISDAQHYFVSAAHEMDTAEKASIEFSIENAQATQEHAIERKEKAERLVASPYFGRVDFIVKGTKETKTIYIGISNFDTEERHLIYDWRAPISSLFYDYEKGNASFIAPAGKTEGKITLKRQYRIRFGNMEYMFDSSLKINDDILQEALSHASSEKMKNIISTIQREQNAIIRDETHNIMLIQGVAGSGKTSIALHRVAYLLYRFKGELTAKNVLILSPNKVFGNYISNVLPELGEENITEIEMEDLAALLLGESPRFQGFYDQVDALSHTTDDAYIENIRFKATLDFAKKLEAFLRDFDRNNFEAEAISVRNGQAVVDASRIQRLYNFCQGKSITEKIDSLTYDVVDDLECQLDADLGNKQKTFIRQQIQGMFRDTRPFGAYASFLKSIGRADLIPKSQKTLEYSDVFPFLYVKSFFEKVELPYPVKYLIIDEMQDYSPIQYMVLSKLFKCKMTILGDSNQAVNPYTSTTIDDIKEVFHGAFCIELLKSYRSTYEIMSFAQKIIPNKRLVMMERHGDEPEIKKVKDENALTQEMQSLFEAFRNNDTFNSLGVICKNQEEADKLYEKLTKAGEVIRLVNSQSKEFTDGIMVVSAHMAKGLEFDQVIIPGVDSENYLKEIDKYMLYVACTRAMHKLTLLYQGKITKFLDFKS